MTNTEPVNVVWGVQWEIFVIPATFEASMPVAPDSMGEDPTDEQRQAWEDFIAANAAFEQEMITLAGDEDNWSSTVAVAATGEDEARATLIALEETNVGNPFNRNFVLVRSVEPVWTPVD